MTSPDSIEKNFPKRDQPNFALFGIVCAVVFIIISWCVNPAFLPPGSTPKDSYYNLLVQGFQAGQLNLKKEVPPGLARLANPYDPAANAAYTTDIGDMSYYNGKLYLYFGVTPVVVLFWPYSALTGDYISDAGAVILFCSAGFLFAAGLLWATWRRYFSELSVWVPVFGILIFGLALGAQIVGMLYCRVYEVAASCGFAFTMVALASIWKATYGAKWKVVWLMLASLAYGLAVGSRPSLLFGIVVLLVPVIHEYRTAPKTRFRSRHVLLLFAAAVIPALLIGAGLMSYNKLRFDNPFEFGWHYQLTTYQNKAIQHQFSLSYFLFNFRYYFLEPLHWGSHFPFLQPVQLSPVPSGYYSLPAPQNGILGNNLIAWVILTVPFIWRCFHSGIFSGLAWFAAAVFLLFAICAFTLCLFFSAFSHYEFDFLPALLLLAVMGYFSMEGMPVSSPVLRGILRTCWYAVLGYAIAFNILASVQARAVVDYFDGNFLSNQGQSGEALEYYQKALALEPASALFHFGLGNAYDGTGHPDEGTAEYQRALDIDPNFIDAAKAHYDMGNNFLFEERTDEAIVQYQKALQIQPGLLEAQNNLGYALLKEGHAQEAASCFEKALNINPGYASAQYNLGRALFHVKREDEAIPHLEKALEINPGFAQNENVAENETIAWLLATNPESSRRDGALAVKLAEGACVKTDYKVTVIVGTLAAAYAEAGRFDDAISTAQKAIAMAQHNGETNLLQSNQELLALYLKHQPYRESESKESNGKSN